MKAKRSVIISRSLSFQARQELDEHELHLLKECQQLHNNSGL